MIILDGKQTASELEAELTERIKKMNKPFQLSIFIVGNNYASEVYVRMKNKAAQRIGLGCEVFALDEKISTEEVITLIEKENRKQHVCGIMVQHPMPKHIDEDRIFDCISPEKDVDGLGSASLAGICSSKTVFAPATAKGTITLMKRYHLPMEGKEAIVIGRSKIVGKPLALMLLNENATVTIAHSRTKNLDILVQRADIVVAALGKPKFIQGSWIKKGAVVIDTGYNEGNVGDVDFDSAKEQASFITPVPGGIGPMTIASLLEQCVISAERLMKNF